MKAYQAGRADAEQDVCVGRLAIEVFGLPSFWESDYANILEQRYHIQIKRVAGCCVNDQIIDHARGYNEVMEAEIQRRFGAGVLEKVEAEAEANREPAPPTSRWHTVWVIPLFIVLLLLSALLWPLSHLVAWIRRKKRGETQTHYGLGDKGSIQHWDDHLTTFVARLLERFLG